MLEGAPVPESDPEIRKIFSGKSVKPGPLNMKETKQLCNFFAVKCGAMGGGGMSMGMGLGGATGGLPPPMLAAAAGMITPQRLRVPLLRLCHVHAGLREDARFRRDG